MRRSDSEPETKPPKSGCPPRNKSRTACGEAARGMPGRGGAKRSGGETAAGGEAKRGERAPIITLFRRHESPARVAEAAARQGEAATNNEEPRSGGRSGEAAGAAERSRRGTTRTQRTRGTPQRRHERCARRRSTTERTRGTDGTRAEPGNAGRGGAASEAKPSERARAKEKTVLYVRSSGSFICQYQLIAHCFHAYIISEFLSETIYG